MKQAILGAVLLLAAGCASRETVRTPDPIRVETMEVVPSTESGASLYVGAIEGETEAALSFPVAGTLAGVWVDEGRFVRKGELLAELDSTSARQMYDAARATLGQAQDACARLKQLYDAQSLPEIKWVEAQTQLRQAESACEIARKKLSDCRLYAPFDGVVGKRQMTVGETAMPGVPVMTILKIGMVKVRFSVPEQEISRLASDSRIRVSVAALDDRVFTAGEIEKGVVANPAAHTYEVTALVANNKRELLPGMVCRVTVSPAEEQERIILPVRAVQRAGDGSCFVWRVSGDSVVRTPIQTGKFSGNGIEIVEGVESGSRVVTDGMQKIGEGSKVVW